MRCTVSTLILIGRRCKARHPRNPATARFRPTARQAANLPTTLFNFLMREANRRKVVPYVAYDEITGFPVLDEVNAMSACEVDVILENC